VAGEASLLDDPAQADVFSALVTDTSVLATGIPLDGRDLYVRLWSQIDGEWFYNDYQYPTAFVPQAACSERMEEYAWIRTGDVEALGGPEPAGFEGLRAFVTPGKIRMNHQPDPDRDLNGAGLLYCANYPMILDRAERELLPEKSLVPISRELLDLRTVVQRQTAYL
jgi:hypothetical protein